MSEVMRVTVGGKELRCQHCGGREFEHKVAALERGILGGFAFTEGLLGYRAAVYACGQCGFAHLFLQVPGADHQHGPPQVTGAKPSPPPPAKKATAEDACLSCGKPIPPAADKCPACGWTWGDGG